MARRGGLKEVQPGHYYATVAGTRYEMKLEHREVVPRRVWRLYRAVDADRLELVQEAPTLTAHRKVLDILPGRPRPLARTHTREILSREWIGLNALAEDLAVAVDQAERTKLSDVQRALGIARWAIAEALAGAERIERREIVKPDEDAIDYFAEVA